MLREIHISNLAVIADARIELHPGLNCFTGTTGAGKSLVIGAIELLLGLRSASEMLRPGTQEARISGVFEVSNPKLLHQIESACDLTLADEDRQILLTRRLHASGRSSISLNGNPITLSMLKTIAEALVDVHGQHDHQYLLKPSNQMDVLDEFAGLMGLRESYQVIHHELQEAEARLTELEAGSKLRLQQLDFLNFQASEIDSAQIQQGEYEKLTARAQVLGHLEKLRKEAGAVHTALYESEGAIIDRLQVMAGIMGELSLLDPDLEGISSTIRDATLQLSEAAFDLGRYLNRLEIDPSELAEVHDRLNILNRLLKKYGPDIESVLRLREELARQIRELEQAGEDVDSIQSRIDPLKQQRDQLASDLHHKRLMAAADLAPRIEKHLAELGMPKAKFRVQVSLTQPGPTGTDAVEFMVQTNPGLAELPLRRIASGGELGRVMLALKSVLAAGDRVSVLVFDEIDANIGGRLGAVIGQKLRVLSQHHQVLCITHLPQIACYADRHLTVRKESEGNQTFTIVRPVQGDDRVQEIAEMIGGHQVTATTLAQARELLENAQQDFATSPAVSSVRKRRSSTK